MSILTIQELQELIRSRRIRWNLAGDFGAAAWNPDSKFRNLPVAAEIRNLEPTVEIRNPNPGF